MRELVGQSKAAHVMDFWSHDHYEWVCRTVIRDRQRLAAIVNKYGLQPGPNAQTH